MSFAALSAILGELTTIESSTYMYSVFSLRFGPVSLVPRYLVELWKLYENTTFSKDVPNTLFAF